MCTYIHIYIYIYISKPRLCLLSDSRLALSAVCVPVYAGRVSQASYLYDMITSTIL